MASHALALRVLAVGPLLALLGAGGMSACGGTSVKHVDDGGTGSGASGGAQQGGSGGTGTGGASTGAGGSGGGGPGLCTIVGDYAGADYVDWNVSPNRDCASGEKEWCFDPDDMVLTTCLDAGVPGASPAGDAAPRYPDCPNVRYLCRTQVGGCCEDAAMLVAGPRSEYVDPGGRCCYLSMPGLHER